MKNTAVTLCAMAIFIALQTASAAAERFKPFTLTSLDGTPTSFNDLLGKATLVVFFYPTCKYCNVALPEIQRLGDKYKNDGLSVVWINVIPEQEKLIAEWRAEHGYTVPILLGGASVQRDYTLVMTPTHYLLDSEGKVLSKRAGYKAGDEKDLDRRIRQALALRTDSSPKD